MTLHERDRTHLDPPRPAADTRQPDPAHSPPPCEPTPAETTPAETAPAVEPVVARLLRTVWGRRSVALGLAVATPAAYGLLAGWWTPRGPITATEALVAMGLGLAAGAAAGALMRSRWAMLLAPVTFVVVFELVRVGAAGPTVDGIHLGTEYGILAFAVGRLLHALLTLLPMLLGAAFGAALARRLTPTTPPRHEGGLHKLALWARRGVAVATTLALVVLAAYVARPAATAPILTPAGKPVAGSVAELTRVDVDGHALGLMIRGRSVDNPVLLFLAGGPGGSELGAMRRHSQALEDHFVVATFDQRGTGRSYSELEPTETLTPDGAVSDVLAVTDHLRERFGAEKIYLVGQSWGTILGVLAVQQRPDLFHAFVGAGQMVSPRETDRVYYRDTLAWARETGDTDLVDTLNRIGPPPYADTRGYEPALSYEHELYPYDHSGNSEGAGQMGENIFVEEYSFMEKARIFAGVLDVFTLLYPQIQDVDLREQAPSLDVPVYLAQGAHETPGRTGPALEWFRLLDAPRKVLVDFDTSGHRPLWEQPEQFHDLLTGRVLAETYPD